MAFFTNQLKMLDRRLAQCGDPLFAFRDQRIELWNFHGVVALFVTPKQEQVRFVLRAVSMEEKGVLFQDFVAELLVSDCRGAIWENDTSFRSPVTGRNRIGRPLLIDSQPVSAGRKSDDPQAGLQHVAIIFRSRLMDTAVVKKPGTATLPPRN